MILYEFSDGRDTVEVFVRTVGDGVFECDDERVDRFLTHKGGLVGAVIGGVEWSRVWGNLSVRIRHADKAVNHHEASIQEWHFHNDGHLRPDGKSSAQIVKEGRGKTKACSRWV